MSVRARMAVRFRLLGEVAADVDGRPAELGPARQRCVLVVLLLEPNRTVPIATLAERVWSERLPRSQYSPLYTYLSRLRSALAAGGVLIVRGARGYRLAVDPEAVDLFCFQRLVAQARAAVDDDAAVDLFDRALRLWRGDAFADLDLRWLRGMRDILHGQRLAAQLDRNDVRLRRGDLAGLLDELFALSAQHPRDERLAAQFMLALYHAGRTAEALEHYHVVRTRLVEELGVDPGAALDRVHQDILRGAVQPVTAAGLRNGVPAQLPRDVSGFIGRGEELVRLDAIVAGAGASPTAAVITAVTGTAGVGKTALAVHWARRVGHRFPDGQLYLNLRGYDPDGSPVDPASAICGFLVALGVPAHRLPPGLAEQVGQYRSLLAGKRILVVLDNARDSAHVRPLLPATPGCLALITSRDQMAGLAATDAAQLLPLDLLTQAQSRQMLAARLGDARVAADPDATEEIITWCARLPLALAVVAARAATRPRFALGTLAQQLREAHGSLDALDGGEADTDIRSVFSWSYHTLSPPAARLFRLFGVHSGPDITAPAAASLAGQRIGEVRPLLAELCRTQLLDEHRPGRYTCHDLLRVYATELANTDETDQHRTAAARRILDHYLHTAHAANDLIHDVHDQITLAEPLVTPEPVVDHQQALAWFAAEHPVLLATVERAAATGWHTHAWQLAWTLRNFLQFHGRWHDQLTVLQTATAAAHRLADPTAQAKVYRSLAEVEGILGQLDNARAHLHLALDLHRRADDPAGQAYAHMGLCMWWNNQGDPARALGHAREAVHLFETIGHRLGHGTALNNVGWSFALLGDYRSTLQYSQQALTLHQQFGDGFRQAADWDSIGYAHHHLGDHHQAITCYQQALQLLQDVTDRYSVSLILTHLGEAHHSAGDPPAARAAWRKALDILTELDHPDADQVQDRLRALQLGSRRVRTSDRRRPGELPLTGRQQEVAELVAEGLTNGEIAERLYVTVKTVEAHVSHICIRLGAANRAAVASIIARAQSRHQ